jgi:dTDP-glucose pyrophosphorylase
MEQNIIYPQASIKEAMEKINLFPLGSTLFVVEENTYKVLGTLTDGDIRRAILNGHDLTTVITSVMQVNFKFLTKGHFDQDALRQFHQAKIKIIPLLDSNGSLIKIYDLSTIKEIVPVEVVIMAGGRGERLKPMTDSVPKPLLRIGDKPIIEHNIDRLIANGIEKITISVNYLGNQIKDYFGDGSKKGIQIFYIDEDTPLGTIGAVSKIHRFETENVLVMNSDLLTNINFADFYQHFISKQADIAVASIPYHVNVPYAVIETEDSVVMSLKEKPTYTYYSNAGIYLFNAQILNNIPKNEFCNATDVLDKAILDQRKIISYPILGYWLDVGKPEDYLKAQEDIKHIAL